MEIPVQIYSFGARVSEIGHKMDQKLRRSPNQRTLVLVHPEYSNYAVKSLKGLRVQTKDILLIGSLSVVLHQLRSRSQAIIVYSTHECGIGISRKVQDQDGLTVKQVGLYKTGFLAPGTL